MLTRTTKIKAAASLAGAALVGLTGPTVSAVLTAAPAYADTGDLVGQNCVSRVMVGPDGFLHLHPADRPDIDIRVPACATPASTPTTEPTRTTVPKPTKTTAPTPKRSTTRRTVCGTWWVKGRDSHGHGGSRPGHRGTWHVVRGCRRV